MHLFITDFILQEDQIIIIEDRVIKHMGKVLRMKKSERFMLQLKDNNQENEKIRYIVEIVEINRKRILGNILDYKKNTKDLFRSIKNSICVALPNTLSKLSLIVQKITEIGIDEIIFRKAEKSQMKGLNTQKIEKLKKISLEASEQSQRWSIPIIRYVKDIGNILEKYSGEIIVFDIINIGNQERIYQMKGNIFSMNMKKINRKNILGIIGPEGGLSIQDYRNIGDIYILQSLGETVLRMETAAIIAGWNIVHLGHILE